MNYRHIYHAGNRCDVVKHATLALLIGALRGKEAGFCVLDTHAGVGLYDLQDERALKTNEAQNGILKLLATKPLPELADYYAVLQKVNLAWEHETGFRFYPGSPLLAYHLLRPAFAKATARSGASRAEASGVGGPQDRLIACEWHEEDARELQRHFRHHDRAHIHHRDGYEALHAFLPPPEKRGLVLIDPPYEETDEFDHLAVAVADAYKRWPQGIFVIWYPIKERPAIWRFHEALVAAGIRKILCAEFIYDEETRADRLNGCGLIIINPPWQMDEKLRHLFPALHEALQTEQQVSVVKWLTEE